MTYSEGPLDELPVGDDEFSQAMDRADLLRPTRHRLDQGEIWKDRQGRERKISEMSDGHRWNAAAMLMREANRLAIGYTISHPLPDPEHTGEIAYSGLEHEEYLRLENPDQWMSQTALYQALTDGLSDDARLNAMLGIPTGAQ